MKPSNKVKGIEDDEFQLHHRDCGRRPVDSRSHGGLPEVVRVRESLIFLGRRLPDIWRATVDRLHLAGRQNAWTVRVGVTGDLAQWQKSDAYHLHDLSSGRRHQESGNGSRSTCVSREAGRSEAPHRPSREVAWHKVNARLNSHIPHSAFATSQQTFPSSSPKPSFFSSERQTPRT